MRAPAPAILTARIAMSSMMRWSRSISPSRGVDRGLCARRRREVELGHHLLDGDDALGRVGLG